MKPTMAKSCELSNLSDGGSSDYFFSFAVLGIFHNRENKITGTGKPRCSKQKAKESPQVFFLLGV